MSSLLFLKRETFMVNMRRKQNEQLFKQKRTLSFSRETLLKLLNDTNDESINHLLDVSAGIQEQSQLLVELGGVNYFYELLQTEKIEEGIMGLGNLCSEKSAQEEILDLDVIGFMIQEVHKYKSIQQLVLRLWFLSILAKFDEGAQNFEQQQMKRESLFHIFTVYQQKYPNIITVQEECFYGFYSIVKLTFIQSDLMQLCCENLNQGIDHILIGIMYYLINDNIKLINTLHQSQFISSCHIYLQIQTRQKYTLKILYYYAQYYVEKILDNEKLVTEIKVIQETEKQQKLILLLLYSMLFKCPSALFMKIINEFDIINYLKKMLEPLQFEQQTLCVIALLKQTKQEIISELIPYLEKIALDRSISNKLSRKLSLLID